MTLDIALVISGDAKGAHQAAAETKADIKELAQTADAASGKVENLWAGSESGAKDLAQATETATGKVAELGSKGDAAMGRVSSSSTSAATGVGAVGREADRASGKFTAFGKTVTSVMTGFAGAVVGGLVVAAFDKLIGKVFEFVEAVVSSEPQIRAAMEKHEGLVDRVTAGYRRAKGAASDYGRDSREVLRFAAQSNAPRLEQSFDTAAGDVADRLHLLQPGQFGITAADAQRINPVLREFLSGVAKGKADVIAFRDEIAKIAKALPVDHPFQETAQDFINVTERAAELSRANDVIRALDGDANAAARAFGAFAGKIVETDNAAGNAIANLTEVQRLMSSISGQGSFTPIPNATPVPVERFAAGGIVTAPTAFRFNVGNSGGGNSGGGQLGVMGEAGPEAILPLVNAGGGLSVGAIGTDNRETTLGLKRLASGKLGVQMPVPFAQGGVVGGGVFPGRESGGVTAFAQGGVAEGGIFAELIALSKGSLKGILTDLVQIKSAADGAAGAILRFSDQILNKALQQGIDALFDKISSGFGSVSSSAGNGGGLFGGLSSLFSSLFKFAAGGIFTNSVVEQPTFFGFGSGTLGVMGEAGPEAILPLMRAGGGFAVGAVANDNREFALPLARLKSGSLGVDLTRPFADGGVFDGPTGPLANFALARDNVAKASIAATPNQTVNHFHISSPNPRAFAEDRASVIRGANRLTRQAGRYT